MKISFIGYGGMTAALASKWHTKHDLFISGRNPEVAGKVATQFGAASGTAEQAVRFGDVIVLAVPAEVAEETISAVGPAALFDGKTVIDITNPVNVETFLTTRTDGRSETEAIAALLPGAHVGKAFNMAHTSVWKNPDMLFDGRPLSVLFTAGDGAAELIAQLIVDAGARPVLIGSNAHAYQLEAAAAITIKFLFTGSHQSTVLNLVDQRIQVAD